MLAPGTSGVIAPFIALGLKGIGDRSYTGAMQQPIEFSLTVAKSKNGSEWNTVSVGRWTPPDEPQLTGEVLPESILEKLRGMKLKGFGDGGTHNVRYGDWYYRFDLLKKVDLP